MEKLRETFIDELRDILDAEKQLTRALPKMAKAAENEDLRDGFEEHLEQTEQHITRLEEVFKLLNEPARGKKCLAMQGLVKEGEEIIEDEAGDAALICAAQKVEHYEIATYGSLVAWGRRLGEDEAVSLLEETLQEEKDTDERLTEIAESHINAEETEQDNEEETQEPRRGTKPKATR